MDPLSGVLSLLKPQQHDVRRLRCRRGMVTPVPPARRHQMLCGGFRPMLARRGGRSRSGAPEDGRLLPAAAWDGRSALQATSPCRQLTSGRCIRRPLNGGIATWNGGGDVSGVGGFFGLEGKHAGILLGMLPPIVHIRKEADKLALRWSIERMMQELREPQPGSFLVLQHLAQMMLVQALRAHLAEGLSGSVGWLFALADQQMSAAIHAMHDDPAHPWTLQELAEQVGMSRSGFAAKFKETVGSTPIDYLISLADAPGRGPAEELRRSHLGHLAIARLRIRERLQHRLQAGHGLFAAAIQPWPGFGCFA